MKDIVVKKRVKMIGEKWDTDMGSLESLLTKRTKMAFQLLRNGSLVKHKEENKGQQNTLVYPVVHQALYVSMDDCIADPYLKHQIKLNQLVKDVHLISRPIYLHFVSNLLLCKRNKNNNNRCIVIRPCTVLNRCSNMI